MTLVAARSYYRPVREGRLTVRRTRSGQERDRGASLVEFALVVPLLTMFLFGIVQFGIAYDMKQSINSAAREGARAAAIPETTVESIGDVVQSSFDSIGSGTVETEIEVAGTTYDTDGEQPCMGNAGETVVVTANTEHVLTIPFFGAPRITLEGKGEFRCEIDG